MTIQVKLYGNLKKKVEQKELNAGEPTILSIEEKLIPTIPDLLKTLHIEEAEVSHIFVNGIFSGLKKKINFGDQIALFPKNMGLLYKWYFKKDEDV
jgi:molybdopterin converting factor small subunit